MILMIGMMSISLFAVLIAVMMYLRAEDARISKGKMVSVYVAKTAINEGTQIDMKQLEIRNISSDTPGIESLVMSEVVGMYAKSDILAQEMIRQDKLSKTPIVEAIQKEETLEIEQNVSSGLDTITLPASVFKNIDSELKTGDRVDIVGIESTTKPEGKDIHSRYIATNVNILRLLQAQPAPQGEKDTEAAPPLPRVEKVVLEMSPGQISRFLSYYYRSLALNQERSYNADNQFMGHMWIVRAGNNLVMNAEKARLMGDAKVRTKTAPLPRLPMLVHERKPVSGIIVYEK